jgi:hypothetical protein
MTDTNRRRRTDKQLRRDRDRKVRASGYIRETWNNLKATEPPPGYTCPDCAAVIDSQNHLKHEQTCPLSAAADRISDEDREYFDTHPGEMTRRRPPVMAEVLSTLLAEDKSLPEPPAGCHWEPAGQVTVTYLGEGVRMRDLRQVCVVAAPLADR